MSSIATLFFFNLGSIYTNELISSSVFTPLFAAQKHNRSKQQGGKRSDRDKVTAAYLTISLAAIDPKNKDHSHSVEMPTPTKHATPVEDKTKQIYNHPLSTRPFCQQGVVGEEGRCS